MMQLPFQFQISPCKKGCQTCLKPFEKNQVVISSFDKMNWERKDFCESCFKALKEEIFWQSQFKPAKAEKEILPPLESEYRLLKELLEKREDEEAFVLALYLQRKKNLALRKDNVEAKMLYEHLESGEMILVPRVSLAHLALSKILARIKPS